MDAEENFTARDWLIEGLRCAGLLSAGAVAGGIAGNAAAGAVLGLLAWVAWQARALLVLYRALKHGLRPSFLPSGFLRPFASRVQRALRAERRASMRLSHLQKRIDSAASSFPDAGVLLGRTGQVLWCNDAAGRLLGLEWPFCAGRPLTDLLRDPLLPGYLASGDFRRPLVMPSPLDATRVLGIRVQGLSGASRAMLLIAADVTRIYNVDALRRDFVANLSHELRSPLTVLAGYLETMQEEFADRPDWSGNLEVMREQTRRMQNMVDDLSQLSRLESEQLPVREDTVPVAEMVRGIVAEAGALSGAARHEIDFQGDPDLLLRGDSEALKSAFSNLVFNAVRHTPAGTRVDISWRRNGESAEFTVADEGPGIAARHLPRLTERFYRVDAGRMRESGGTGLGLAIVKHVLVRHGGELHIDSRPGHGASFRCVFPASALIARMPHAT